MSANPPPQSVAEMIGLLRKATETYGDVEQRPPLYGVRSIPVVAGGVPAEWLIPDGLAGDATIVYFHGGGWAAGSL
ncbi:MAG: hypothetical protein ABJA20_11615, partial [Novosphingobium sp.]